SPAAASAASPRSWRCGRAASTRSSSSRPKRSARLAPASSSVPTPPASCARSGLARRWRAFASIRKDATTAPGMMATASTTLRSARAEAEFGSPYYHAHRADLLDVLLEGVANQGFRLKARIDGFEQTADQIIVTLADGTKV